jgi:CheY-like chemotaxis protein
MPEKRSGKVLVVDDEKNIRETVARVLHYEG